MQQGTEKKLNRIYMYVWNLDTKTCIEYMKRCIRENRTQFNTYANYQNNN